MRISRIRRGRRPPKGYEPLDGPVLARQGPLHFDVAQENIRPRECRRLAGVCGRVVEQSRTSEPSWGSARVERPEVMARNPGDDLGSLYRDSRSLDDLMADVPPLSHDDDFAIADMTDEEREAFGEALHE